MNLSYDDLLVFALYNLQNTNSHTTFENLVANSFKLFPKRFQLPGYSEWPDSSLIDKSWLRCRTDKGLIYGNKSKGFTLTLKGTTLAKKVYQILQDNRNNNFSVSRKGDSRTRSGRIVKHVENSQAYQKYKQNKSIENISEFEFCDLLYSTLDTEPVFRRRNMEELKYHSKVYERQDILDFLKACDNRYGYLLKDSLKENYEGGMMKRKKTK